MKKYFVKISRIFMIIAFIFLMVIINTDAKVENQEKYNIMQKANHNIEKNKERIKDNSTSEKEDTKNNEQVKEKSDKTKQTTTNISNKEVKETVKDKKEEKTEVKVNNNAVTQTSSTKESVQNDQTNKKTDETKYGTFGRLYVSSYDVALYDYNVHTTSDSTLQTLVDNKDSAAYYKNRGRLVIADHYNQGFKVLVNLTEGSTAYIKLEDGSTLRYRLIKKSEGTNTGPDLVDNEGNSFYAMDSDLIMYTCYDGGIMATLWVLS